MIYNIIEKQQLLQQGLNTSPEKYKLLSEQMQKIRDTCLSMNVELAELLEELPWKPWKPVEHQQLNADAALEEAVDVLIFFLDLWLYLCAFTDSGDPTTKLVEILNMKQNKNLNRIKKGEFK